MKRTWWPGSLAWLALGCAHSAPVTLGPEYFKHNDSGYEMIYAGDGPSDALGEGWKLDNYQRRPAGGAGSGWFAKEGDAYVFARAHDLDGDGVTDLSLEESVDDLRFKQQQGAGVVWLRSVTLADSLADKPLEVLARRYRRRVARDGVVQPHFGEGLPSHATGQAYEVSPLGESGCEVANVQAFRIDFDVREVGGEAPERVRLVWIKPGYQRVVRTNSGAQATYPVVLLAGYRNRASDFESGERGLDALLDGLSLAKGQRPHTCRPTEEDPSPGAGGEDPGEVEAQEPEGDTVGDGATVAPVREGSAEDAARALEQAGSSP